MNKRGQAEVLEFHLIFEILTAIIIATFFILGALGFHQYSKFDKLYLELDTKMLMNSLLSSPGDVVFDYEHSKVYNIYVTENDVTISRDLSIIDLVKKRVHYFKFHKLGPLAKIGGSYHD